MSNLRHRMRTLPDLAQNEIHLWYSTLDRLQDEALIGRYRALLDPIERQKGERFRFERDRHRHLVTRALARTTLARYLDARPEQLTFTANAFGKPAVLAGPGTSPADLTYNISHTNSLVILAVARGRKVGVDVEDPGRSASSVDIAERFFSPRESAALQRIPAARRSLPFFQLWTLKEAYIKARGKGLSIPLDQIDFHFPDEERLCFSIAAEQGDRSRWHFWQFEIGRDHVGALCAERHGQRPPLLVARETLPLVSEQIVPLRILRRSE